MLSVSASYYTIPSPTFSTSKPTNQAFTSIKYCVEEARSKVKEEPTNESLGLVWHIMDMKGRGYANTRKRT